MPAATVYTCRVTSWSMFWLTVFFFLIPVSSGIWMGTGPQWQSVFLAVVLLLNLVLAVVAISQRVTAGPAGLTVSLGPFGLPRVRVARASIAHAEMIYLTATFWTGAGVFWRPKRGWFLTPKLGPVLRLRLTSGRTITVSVAEPAAAMWAMGIAVPG
ncbi:hypothetical protein ACFXPS_43905 [Nocardia sp. NPDC059091]|uniref:hypothetical protein n=1 Tax=unclassified Nocardia TaxID=2637762 RepID=UPI0036CDAE56